MSKLEAESAVRLSETYEYTQSDYMSLRLPFQKPVEFKRSMLVSYLDEELLVVRDAAGRPDILMCAVAAAANPPDAPRGGGDGETLRRESPPTHATLIAWWRRRCDEVEWAASSLETEPEGDDSPGAS